MRAIFFLKGDLMAASSRHRGFFVANELNKHGIEAVVYPPGKGVLPRSVKLVLFSDKNNIYYLQRIVYYSLWHQIMVVGLLFILRRKVLFDFDDAVYFHAPLATKLLCRLSTGVVVGSHALADWAKRYNPNVYIIPTVVSPEKYRHAKNKNKTIVLGWNGNGRDQVENLKLLVPVFKQLIKSKIKFKFILIGALGDKRVSEIFNSIKGLDITIIDRIDWRDPEIIAKNLAMFDIGLNPLVDDAWNRSKCAFKMIEYMAVGIPVVASNVGENKFVVEDAKNGYLVNTTGEWVTGIRKLATSRALRQNIGRVGRRTIVKHYSYEAIIPKLMAIFDTIGAR